MTFQVQYAFTGFLPPIEGPPALNSAKAGSAVPVKFVVAGGSGISTVLGGGPTSRRVDCETLEPLGDWEPIDTPGSSGFRFLPSESAYQANWKTDEKVGRHVPRAQRRARRRHAPLRAVPVPLEETCGGAPGLGAPRPSLRAVSRCQAPLRVVKGLSRTIHIVRPWRGGSLRDGLDREAGGRRSASALSVRSHVKSWSSRPKWPYAAVFA